MATLNLREVPDDLHRSLKIRAAEKGTNVKALVIRYCIEGLKRDRQIARKGGQVMVEGKKAKKKGG